MTSVDRHVRSTWLLAATRAPPSPPLSLSLSPRSTPAPRLRLPFLAGAAPSLPPAPPARRAAAEGPEPRRGVAGGGEALLPDAPATTSSSTSPARGCGEQARPWPICARRSSAGHGGSARCRIRLHLSCRCASVAAGRHAAGQSGGAGQDGAQSAAAGQRRRRRGGAPTSSSSQAAAPLEFGHGSSHRRQQWRRARAGAGPCPQAAEPPLPPGPPLPGGSSRRPRVLVDLRLWLPLLPPLHVARPACARRRGPPPPRGRPWRSPQPAAFSPPSSPAPSIAELRRPIPCIPRWRGWAAVARQGRSAAADVLPSPASPPLWRRSVAGRRRSAASEPSMGAGHGGRRGASRRPITCRWQARGQGAATGRGRRAGPARRGAVRASAGERGERERERGGGRSTRGGQQPRGSDVAVHVGGQHWSYVFWTSSDTLE
ncbi:hypothetical protein PVAP13_5NG572100 [Panicum virgatum]|uniref:Uncharacterized protein n=1 Tax=Panicum virgatum TaxID=38727 RepID=A0A8T0S203_PANVG|nr:hypothetical protein PVAP13_5NG572100 [Panicum virgatum]